ncbi:MAG: LemA family protein [Elusimicrobiales bacterium]
MVIFTVAVVVVLLWGAVTYNALITLRNNVANGFRQIDVQLKRRYDLIPNLVNAVKGEMKFEKETLERVIAARGAALAANSTGNVSDISKKEGELSSALGRLLAISENYPNLKASENVKTLMEEVASTENKIAFARQFYNDIVTAFNTKQQVFPSNFVAQFGGFKPADLFAIPESSAEERQAPKVDLAA